MTKSNIDASAVLSTLSSEAQEALRSHFRQEVVLELTGGAPAASAPAPARRRQASAAATPVKRSVNRVKTADGRSGSQWVRDYDKAHPDQKASDVVEAASAEGLEITDNLVYNVRNQLKKKQEEAKAARAAKRAAAPVKESADKGTGTRKAKKAPTKTADTADTAE